MTSDFPLMLLPCPHCEGETKFFEVDVSLGGPRDSQPRYRRWVMCLACGAMCDEADTLPEFTAVEAWNRRGNVYMSLPVQRELVMAMRKFFTDLMSGDVSAEVLARLDHESVVEMALRELEQKFVSDRSPVGAPVAYLFRCRKPGKQIVYASVDPNDTNHWPVDQWKSIRRSALVEVDETPMHEAQPEIMEPPAIQPLPSLGAHIADAARVIEWANRPNRPRAQNAFTDGPERQAAYWIEWAEERLKNQAATLKAD